MRKIIAILLITIFVIPLLQAKGSNTQASFIEDMTGARGLAMGGAYRTLVNDPSALIWNPAGLSSLPSKQSFLLEQSEVMFFVSSSFAGYGRKLDDNWTLGLGAMHTGDEVLRETVGYLSLSGDGVVLNRILGRDVFSRDFMAFGLTAKYFNASFGGNSDGDYWDFFGLNHRVTGSANGYGLDAGLIVRLSDNDLLGVTFKNLVADIFWESSNQAGTALGPYSDSLPINWIIGYAREQERLKLGVDVNKSLYYDVDDYLHLGVEYQLVDNLAVRGGYSQELVSAESKIISFGTGIKVELAQLPNLQVNIAYRVYQEWEGNNSFLLSLQIP